MHPANQKRHQSLPKRERRPRPNRRSVRIADSAARRIISVGGIAVIAAVLGIVVYLVREALPLFSGAQITGEGQVASEPSPIPPVVDSYKTLVVTLSADNRAIVRHVRSGKVIQTIALPEGFSKGTVGSTQDGTGLFAVAPDGLVHTVHFGYTTNILSLKDLPPTATPLSERDYGGDGTVYSVVPGNQIRQISVNVTVNSLEVPELANLTVDRILYRQRDDSPFALIDTQEQGMMVTAIAQKENLFTGEVTKSIAVHPVHGIPSTFNPRVWTATLGMERVFASDGHEFVRIEIADDGTPTVAEFGPLLAERRASSISMLGILFGGQTLIVGTEEGGLYGMYVLARNEANSDDGFSTVHTKTFRQEGPMPLMMAISQRDKSFLVAFSDGSAELLHGTSLKTILKLQPKEKEEILHVQLSPRSNGAFLANSKGELSFWDFDAPHPETTWSTLFGKVWYEGYSEPTFTWQSSASTDDFEPKLSLIPLIFGTMKATAYSLMFAIPLALLGAIYTSEFLSRRTRAVVKPMMELMSSLPTVVLGFVAALVLAPIIEAWIGAVLLCFLALPATLIITAFIWQALPESWDRRISTAGKFSLKAATVVFGLYLSYNVGILMENWLFQGDFKAWLINSGASATPFLFLISIPLGFALVLLIGQRLNWKKLSYGQGGGIAKAAASTFNLAFLIFLGLGAAFLIAYGLSSLGIDPRGGFVDKYVQRNSLVVGLAMGFAVIPIIYTLSEDALNAVPTHLRSASLGCGATPWQTAIYVVIPTAVSGIFSAIMIGMGRAVGETMIVVMAAGNTPVMEWNIFNGLRALSATIAVELPEAVKGGTLYRVLFLAALVLFIQTFIINTMAEGVRQHFRRKAKQL